MTKTKRGNTAHQTADSMAAGAQEAMDRFAESANAATDHVQAKGKQLIT